MSATGQAAEVPRSGIGLYARLWRWHFFAALVVIPFVLWQSVTGVLYLWRDDLAQLFYPQLMTVAPAAETASVDRQLASVLEHHSRETLTAIEISDDATRSTAFFFRDDNGLPYPAFVNPHTGAYLGSVQSTRWLAGLTRGLHGGWPIQPYGSYLLELGASWAIVMTLTGLYLWWPRNATGLAGVLYPRLRAGSRVFWRDLHSTVGVYFALIFISFLFTALPWTTFWGEKILAPIEKVAGQQAPNGFFFASGHDHHHASAPGDDAASHAGHADHAGHHASELSSIDALIASARAAGARGRIELHPTTDGSPVNVRDQHARAPDEVWLRLDGASGAVLTRVVWQDFPAIPRFVALGVDLHEGTFFGRANQVFNTLVALALVWLSVTGFVGWYKRRPSSGGLAAPPRRDVRISAVVLGVGALLCVLLPMLGASVLAIAILDKGVGRLLAFRTRM
jgi:uncharacterized iron-regulated membrane protein